MLNMKLIICLLVFCSIQCSGYKYSQKQRHFLKGKLRNRMKGRNINEVTNSAYASGDREVNVSDLERIVSSNTNYNYN